MLKDDFVDDKINKSLKKLNQDEEEKIAMYIAEQNYIPYINLKLNVPENDALERFPEEYARKYNIAPFKYNNNIIHLGVIDPTNKDLLLELDKIKKEQKIILYAISKPSLLHVLERYKDINRSHITELGKININPEHIHSFLSLNSVDNLKAFQDAVLNLLQNVREEKITRLIEALLYGAIHFKSSDIHIEPEEENVRYRYRTDGELQDIFWTDKNTFESLSNRFKLLSGLKISKKITQDGRFSIGTEDNIEIEMRVSIVPGEYGDNYVMRVLDPRSADVPLESLGMNKILYKALLDAITKPFGMILNTGPTGSGKTTTLYACLKKVYHPEIKIITIEDPIEYRFEGITQTQVDIKNNYTFVAGLRAAMRQDPDIIMIGEIRDVDTSNTAVNAALTGHIVLSTLHTNSAAGVIPRLLGFGVEPGLIGSSMNLMIAQRLCRKLCPECKVQIVADINVANIFTKELGKMLLLNPDLEYKPSNEYIIYRANINGCEKCNKGYKGRIAVAEGILMNPEIESVLNIHTTESQVREVANKQGIPTLKQDVILKILNGLTSFEEASSVIDMKG